MSEEAINAKMDFEERSLPARAVGYWVGGLLVGLVLTMVGIYAIYGAPTVKPDVELVTTRPMTQPMIQPNPSGDMAKFLKQQNEALESYGWVDRGRGVVRIPIDLAIELVLERGFPVEKE